MKYQKLDGWKYRTVETESILLPDCFALVGITTNYAKITVGYLTIYKNYAWDGPSVTPMHTKNFMYASLCHDCLYQLMREGHLDKQYCWAADNLLRKHCLEAGMSGFRAWYVYSFVRTFSKYTLKPDKDHPVIEV